MKKFILTAFVLFIISLSARAQYEYAEWGVGASYGTTLAYSDLRTNDTQRGYSASIFWNYSPYLPFAFEGQTGTLSGGGLTTDPYGRYFTNNYLAFNVHADLQLGEITEFEGSFLLERLKGLYSGLGVGAIFNNITKQGLNDPYNPTYFFPVKPR